MDSPTSRSTGDSTGLDKTEDASENIYIACNVGESICSNHQRCCCVVCDSVSRDSEASKPSGHSEDLIADLTKFNQLDLSSGDSLNGAHHAYECISASFREVTTQFRLRDQSGSTYDSPRDTALQIWGTISNQHIIHEQLDQILINEIEKDSEFHDDRNALKRIKDGLRRALHILSDSCCHRHCPPILRPSLQLPIHYQPTQADFDEVGLGEAFTSNSFLTDSTAARINAALGTEVSAVTKLHDAISVIWARVPGAGPRIARIVRAAMEPAPPEPRWSRYLSECACASSCQLISPGVYLGSYRSATDADAVAAMGATCVVNCTAYRFAYPPAVSHAVRCAVDQDCYSCRQLRPALRQLRRWLGDGRTTVVHCVEGRFRSATVAAAWLVIRAGLPADAAAARVRALRPWARPKRFALRALEMHARTAAAAAGCGLEEAVLGLP
jgi:hypothetical protein